MEDSRDNPSLDKSFENKKSDESSEMDLLRNLIVGPEQIKISRLKERLDDPEIRIKEISDILPDAILLRTSKDEKIAKSIGPTVEKAIEVSIRKNRKVLVDALFPVMGPAIRKAVSSTIMGMIQSFNKALEYSFSIQGLKWRFEALRTRKPFAEIVMINTLLYQVEQIFLIHRDSSLVIQHIMSKDITIQDPDLVSSMLSAIRDFVQDSFSVEKEDSLDTLRIGSDRSIWIEQGPYAVLAAVIRGTPPMELRTILRETLDNIHLTQSDALENFDGDSASFEVIRPDLEECLQSRFKPKKKKISPLLWILLILLAIAAGIYAFNSVRNHRHWTDFIKKLNSEPGIIITNSEKHSGKYYIFGLRDPVAADPLEISKEMGLDSENINYELEPYRSLDPELNKKRNYGILKRILKPPKTVELILNDDILKISGSASHRWITESRELIRSVPGVSRYDDSSIIDADLQNFIALKEKIENDFFLFEFRSAEMIEDQEDNLKAFLENLKDFLKSAEVLQKTVDIDIIGHADSTGTEEINMKVSQARADKVLFIITSEGIDAKYFSTLGVGSTDPYIEEKTDQDRELNRRVTFRVNG